MIREIIEILENLKQKPSTEKVDHILLLEKIYSEYSNGMKELEPIAHFYLNGCDDLPTLKEKDLWNKSKFAEIRKDFVNAHSKLVEIIESTIRKIKSNEFDSFDYHLSRTDFLELIKSGKTTFEHIDLENIDLRNENLSGITFKNCFISADFRNADLSYTKFIKSNIKTCDFRNAYLTNGLMENVSFESTRFKGAKVDGFIFKDNHCHSVEGIGQIEFYDWIIET
ncbi:MAG: pentapeptide repeat-containing protein [Flavobacteriaceae bacterium]|nr:pentapeptide repeat-containing protein [Flavobacteriaceae bacterium]